MDNVLKFLSDPRVLIAIGVIVILLIIWFIVQKVRANSFRSELTELEQRYNAIKTVPLSFKLNKAVAISRVDTDAMQRVAKSKDDFHNAEANLKQIGTALADAEDAILVGKLKQAKNDLKDLHASISLGEEQVSKLDAFLDSILEKETAKRQEVTELKNQFRELKAHAQENSDKLNYCWPTIQNKFSEIEKEFSAFEEWMYASDFEKASNELAGIQENMTKLTKSVDEVPALLEDARGVVPNMLEVLHKDYTAAKTAGVYLRHLEIEKSVDMIVQGLKQDLENLRNCETEGIRTNLDSYKTRLTQMNDEIKQETSSVETLSTLTTDTDELIQEAKENCKYVKEQYEKMSVRFGLENLDNEIEEEEKVLQEILDEKPKMEEITKGGNVPASEIVSRLQAFQTKLSNCSKHFDEMKARIDSASGDEDRAKKQLVKLQVIMNQIQVSIRKYKLPSISVEYEKDLNRANEYIYSLQKLIDETPLNVTLLNSTLSEAIAHIYQLYNNVNNVVGAVMMVENTIVFGNRYRSTYADIDSELTRSELCFRNGEYTQALSIAIATIEKIHPGNYEKMIKENAEGGEN